ncbi:MAG: glycolate oxidase binding subunit [Actinomycetota bacterium]|nr:glycolate oxidase binding subunit [Actinomycetota bacterium]
MKSEQPASYEEAAEWLRSAAADGRPVRFRGGGTKLGWGRPVPEPDLELCTGGLDRVLEHNAGDFTAVLQAGVPLAVAQDTFASAGQMLALDPPLSPWGAAGDDTALDAADGGATIGGIVATADSGPLRHRYGGVRDLVVGVTVVLSDGTVARAGGKVIKNVAGYDLGKLFAGAFGTLGLIAEVTMRLHPRPARTATVVARSSDPAQLAAAAAALAHAPLEADCLDLWWDASTGAGAVLVRFGSANPFPRAEEAATLLGRVGDLVVETDDDDPACWDAQRAAQRSDIVVKVSALPAALPASMAAAQALGGTLVARAGLGLAWIQLPVGTSPGEGGAGSADAPADAGRTDAPADAGRTGARGERGALDAAVVAEAVEELRRRLAPAPCVLLDAPAEVRAMLDPWGGETGPVALMRKVKERFDPAGVCAPGLFVGGI